MIEYRSTPQDPKLAKSWARAFDKAAIIGGDRRLTVLSRNRFKIKSATTADTYWLRVYGFRYWCTCPAGMNDRPCWHVAKLIRYRQQSRDVQRMARTVSRTEAEAIVAALYD